MCKSEKSIHNYSNIIFTMMCMCKSAKSIYDYSNTIFTMMCIIYIGEK